MDSIDCYELCIEDNCVPGKMNVSQSNNFNYESVTTKKFLDFCNDKEANFDHLYDICEEGQLADYYQYVSDFTQDSYSRDIMVQCPNSMVTVKKLYSASYLLCDPISTPM